MKLIDKAAVVEKLERLYNLEYSNTSDLSCGKKIMLRNILCLLDTLEVKEVDFDFTKEVDMWVKDNGDTNGFFNVQDLAKYFFKLGLKAQKGE